MNTVHESGDDPEFDTFPDSTTRDFAMALDATWQQTRNSTFAEVVAAYKRVEDEFTLRAGDNEIYVLDFRRGIAECILKTAVDREEPFEVCEKLWNELLGLGFTDIEQRCTMSWYFADGCLYHQQTQTGLRVVEPVMAELERLLAESTVTEHAAEFYRYQLDIMQRRLDKLRAQLGKTST
jgi:hypothetical protein